MLIRLILVALLLARPAGADGPDAVGPDFMGPVIAGPPETAFDWSTDRCAAWDIPDAPARAWRGPGGLHLLAGSDESRVSVGPSLDRLERRCEWSIEGRRTTTRAATTTAPGSPRPGLAPGARSGPWPTSSSTATCAQAPARRAPTWPAGATRSLSSSPRTGASASSARGAGRTSWQASPPATAPIRRTERASSTRATSSSGAASSTPSSSWRPSARRPAAPASSAAPRRAAPPTGGPGADRRSRCASPTPTGRTRTPPPTPARPCPACRARCRASRGTPGGASGSPSRLPCGRTLAGRSGAASGGRPRPTSSCGRSRGS
jgi:hypothetical protein